MDSKKQAEGIASLGRFGDTTLMHMRPDEVEQLTAMSRANGGDITINPKTGMPEAFLGNFFSALAPTAAGLAAGALFPGAPFLAPALAGGATSFLQGKRDPLSIGMGALGGYGGGQLGASLRGFGATKAATPELAGTAEIGGGTAGTSTFVPTDTTIGGANLGTPPTAVANSAAVGQPMPAYMQTQGGFTPTYTTRGPDFTPQQVDVPYRDQFNVGPQQMLDTSGQPIPPLQGPVKQAAFEQGLDLGKGLAETGKGFGEAVKDPMEYLKYRGGDDAFTGGIKTALPFAGAGAEAYMKGYYEDTPQPEDDRRRYYDPTRVLDLGGDTGLRLLAKGGKVAFADGGEAKPLSHYGIEPQYQTRMVTDQFGMSRPAPAIGPMYGMPGQSNQVRVPVTGFVDVGGKFKADPKGDITDVEYEKRFSYVTEGLEKQDDGGGDFDSVAGGAGGAGMNPLAALKVAQGYADSQQSDTASTGLGGLKKGGKIHYKKGGGTTAEQTTAKTATPAPATTADMLAAKKLAEEEGANALAGIGGLQNMIPESVNVDAIRAQLGGMADGGVAELTPDDGKMLNGMGDGVSDDIPAMIEGQQEAALSDGEFIVPARIVSELGNGSSDAGAKKLYSMIDRIQAARKQTIGDNKEYAKDTNAERFMPA